MSGSHEKTPPARKDENWPSDWLRATLGLAALRALEEGPSYGYAIIAALADAGFGTIKGGTLYPLLSRLENAGHIATEWRPGEAGPGRKFFALTDTGRATLTLQHAEWIRFAGIVNDHLTPGRTLQP
jgi:PadR family transcriptional regulator PadR